MDRPSRYALRTASVLSAATAGRRPPLLPLGLGGVQPVVGQFPLEVPQEFAGGGQGLHHELRAGRWAKITTAGLERLVSPDPAEALALFDQVQPS
jgi:hypothetical protein